MIMLMKGSLSDAVNIAWINLLSGKKQTFKFLLFSRQKNKAHWIKGEIVYG